MKDNDVKDDLSQTPLSPPVSPQYPPLASASLFPPPPSNHILFTPLNTHFYSLLKHHWPEEGSAQARDLLLDDASGQSVSSSSSGWNRRLLLQRAMLLKHASTLKEIPQGTKDLSPDVQTDGDLARAIQSISAVDLQLEMDPPDLSIISDHTKGYHLFGQWWPVPAVVTGIEEAGIKRLYQEVRAADGSIGEHRHGSFCTGQGLTAPFFAFLPSQDRRPALQLLLRSLVRSYLKLLSLLQFPPSYFALSTVHAVIDPENPQQLHPPDFTNGNHSQEEISWLTTSSSEWTHLRSIALNIQEVLNKSRKDQAKKNLEQLMADQIENKRRDMQKLKDMMVGVRGVIASLRDDADGQGARHQVDAKKLKLENGANSVGMEIDS